MDEKKEYIERGALIEAWDRETENATDLYDAFDCALESVPAADVVEVVHGYWKWETKIEPQAQNRLYCSVCDNECLAKGDYYEKSKYCPHCGAKMDGKRKEQT